MKLLQVFLRMHNTFIMYVMATSSYLLRFTLLSSEATIRMCSTELLFFLRKTHRKTLLIESFFSKVVDLTVMCRRCVNSCFCFFIFNFIKNFLASHFLYPLKQFLFCGISSDIWDNKPVEEQVVYRKTEYRRRTKCKLYDKKQVIKLTKIAERNRKKESVKQSNRWKTKRLFFLRAV